MSYIKSISFLLIAFISGIAMAVQGSINSAASRAIGLSESTFLVHLTATIAVVIIMILGFARGNFKNFNSIPWYYYTGGIVGVVITYCVVISIPKLGAAIATTAIIVGQVLTACIIDHFGLFGLEKSSFTWSNLVGLIFLSIGAKLLLE